MLRRRRAGLAVTAALGATALFAPAAASAANFNVTTNGDAAGSCTASTGSADCDTLRAAITAANGNSEDDVITFDSSLSGQTIALGSNLPQIDASSNALSIQGPAAHDVTIDGSDEWQIFNVSGSHPVDISGLTLTNGYVHNTDGGALYTDSDTDVTVSNSVFTGNRATGGNTGNNGGNNGGNGGAIGAHGPITVTDSQFSDNHASQSGGAIFTEGGIFASNGGLTVRNSTISGNGATLRGGGIAGAKYVCSSSSSTLGFISSSCSPTNAGWFHSDMDIAGSTISDNSAYAGGGISAPALLAMSGSTVQSNHAGIGAGIDSSGKYAQTKIADSTISSNVANRVGGGINVAQDYKYSNPLAPAKHAVESTITRTTIADNRANSRGAGMSVLYLGDGDKFTVSHSTISGNDAASGEASGLGGGIYFSGYGYNNISEDYVTAIDGKFSTVNTTISGNTADIGGGVSVGGQSQEEVFSATGPLAKFLGKRARKSPTNPQYGPMFGPYGSIDLQNSTVSSNSATQFGGGVYLNQYRDDPFAESPNLISPTIALTSSIVADNSANGAPNDAERPDGSVAGGLNLAFSDVENPGNVPVVASQSSLTGVDPQLGPLVNNGGPTLTQLPSTTSPIIDQGKAPARLLDDQRGLGRTVQGDVADAAAGDGTDIGATEVQNPAKNIVGPSPAQQLPNTGDTTPPKIGLKVPKSLSIQQLIAGFNVTVSCNEPCAMTFRLYGSAPTGTLHSAGYNFRLLNRKIGRKAGRRRVHLQPCLAGSRSSKRTHVCRKRITAALFAKPQKTFKVKLIVAAKDKAGNISHRKRFIRIHH